MCSRWRSGLGLGWSSSTRPARSRSKTTPLAKYLCACRPRASMSSGKGPKMPTWLGLELGQGSVVRVRIRVRVRVRVQRPWPHDAREHTGDAVVLEEDVAGEELGEDGAEGPKVDLLVVRQAEDDLGCAVGARLHGRREKG